MPNPALNNVNCEGENKYYLSTQFLAMKCVTFDNTYISISAISGEIIQNIGIVRSGTC